MTSEEKLNAIIECVKTERKKRNIAEEKLGIDSLPEPSCYASDEYRNLFWFQLLKTKEGCGGWKELKNPEILEGVYLFVSTELGVFKPIL